jgi:DNA-binding NarL/FixJ family response regulator
MSEAVELTDDAGQAITSPPLLAEYLGCRALAVACSREPTRAREAIASARNVYPQSVELRVLKPCSEAVLLLLDGKAPDSAVARAWSSAKETGNYDSFVCAYRAEPGILASFPPEHESRRELGGLLNRAADDAIARQFALPVEGKRRGRDELLTEREAEVLHELEEGSSNREIATRLFISEATVKVHLRHIYEKLGVRNRAELLARRARRP